MTTQAAPMDRVIVTGLTGFVGSHLARELLDQGVEVHAIVRDGARLDRVPDLVPQVTLHVDDGSTSTLIETVGAIDPSVCFHLATHFVAEHTSEDVETLAESNLAFPMRLAEAVARSGCPVFVSAGTAWQHVGGQRYYPKSLYAATKQAFEDVLRHYALAGAFRVCTLVLYDTYGPDDPRPKLLSVLDRALRTGQPVEMNSGDALVDLVHIDDVVAAFLAAADATRAGSDQELRYAVSSGTPLSVREIVDVVGRARGAPVPVIWGARPDRRNEMLTPWHVGPPPPGWSAKVSLEEGLRRLNQT
jgi:nucleoside-diphosphate-sugar epimerase